MLKKILFMLAIVHGLNAPLLHAIVPEPKIHQISIQNFVFVPAHIEVQAGDVVEWANRDFAPHTATANNGSWDTDAIKNGVTNRIVASVPGLIAYHCAYHPGMTGVIVVTAPAK
jgi:plastocyanin